MSRNAAKVRYRKKHHRDQFGRFPSGMRLEAIISQVTPPRNALMDLLTIRKMLHG